MFEILYHNTVKKDIKGISKPEAERIKNAIETKLTESPQDYCDRLKGELGDYWKMRVGDYRVVFKVEKESIIILGIIHGKEIYKRIIGRV